MREAGRQTLAALVLVEAADHLHRDLGGLIGGAGALQRLGQIEVMFSTVPSVL